MHKICLGAEHSPEEAWTTAVTFAENEGMLEQEFYDEFDGSALQVYPDEPTRYVLKGKWEKLEIIDFALGKIPAHRNPIRSTENVELDGKYL